MAALPLSGGSVMVADAPNTISLFTPAGTFARAIGGSGNGPGEFSGLDHLGLLHDTVWTTDVSLRRTTLFRTDGAVIRTISWENEVSGGEGRNMVHGLFGDGTSWGENDAHVVRAMRGGPELPKAVVRMTRSGRVMDTLAMVPTSHTMYVVLNDGGMTFGQQKFPDGALVVGAPELSRLYVIDRAAPSGRGPQTVRVVALKSTGDTIWVKELPYSPRPLEKAVADSFISKAQSQARRSGASPEVVRRALHVPAFRPPVTSAFAAVDGTLWLRREEGRASVEYWVLSPSGATTATITTPRSVVLTAARADLVWGTELDHDDVPTVVRFRLTTK